LWGTLLNARPVTEAETTHIATQWLRANPHLLTVSGDATLTEVKSKSGALLLRKVAYPSGGALLVAADTRLPPVIAALPRGRISQTHPTMLHVKADVEARLQELPQTDDDAWQTLLSDTPTQPITHPLYVFDATRWEGELDHWNQESFNRYGKWEEGTLYNRYTPEKYMVGCVAIAGSAIQQFYAFPAEQCAYTNTFCAVYGEDMRPQFRPLQTRPGAYDWQLLPKRWQKSQTLTEAQSELLARIAANSGVITGTHYASTASGGSTYFLMEGLRRGAGYATGMEYCPTNTTQMHDFLSNLLYAQLRCGAPCVLDLGGKAGNHAVTAVGIAEDHHDTPYTRIFFGWGGSGDVWYALPTRGSFHGILGVGTFVSTDGAFLPIYGTLLNDDGTPAKHHALTIAGQTTTTDAKGRFATRIKPMPNVTLTAGDVSTTLTLDADLLSRAAVESWALDNNPRAVSTDALLNALPQPITLRLPPQKNSPNCDSI
jgi:hypothetical protein